MYPKSQRRSPVFSDEPYMHYKQEELYHRRPPPRCAAVGYGDRQRLSPLRSRDERGGHRGERGGHRGERGGHRGERGGHRGGFREHSKGFNTWERPPKSPVRSHGEALSSTLRFHSDHQPRDAKMGKRREEQGGSWEAFRAASSRPEKWEAGWGRGRRSAQGCNRERPGDDSRPERSPPFKRQRRKLEDGEDQHGYRNKEIEEQLYAPGDKCGRDAGGSSGPLIIEHDHGFRPHGKLSRAQSREHQDHGSDAGRPRSSHPAERYRAPEDGPRPWEDASGRRDDGRSFRYPETRRNAAHPGATSAGAYGKPKGKAGFQSGRAGPHGIQARVQEPPRGFPDVPHQEQRSEGQAFAEDNPKSAKSAEAGRHEESRTEPWLSHRSRSRERSPPAIDLDPKMPRGRMLERNRAKPKNEPAVPEETLTIKVDMKRPVSKDSVLCYSSDRQLSLDLVNVGRQRLDFLPMLEHSGTYHETPTHTGTFAQEIITLVHHVKERYFGGGGITLDERFSAPRKAGFSEEQEAEKLTLNQRFSSKQCQAQPFSPRAPPVPPASLSHLDGLPSSRGFSVNVNSLLHEEESSSSSPSLLPPVRGPGDLRHDLERRRQERIEGVKVTIAGSGTSQRPLGAASKTSAEYREEDGDPMVEPEGFSHLPAQHRRPEFNMGSKRGGPHRPFKAFARRGYGIGNQFRRQKRYNFQAGPNS